MRKNDRKTRSAAMLLACVAGMAMTSAASAQVVFYEETFDSAVLDQVSGDPRVTSACASNVPRFTHNPPAGWVWTGCGMPSFECRVGGCPPRPGVSCGTCGNNEGVYEWEGWSYVNKDWWVSVAGDQNRSQFTLGLGNVAVADPDEWDDRGNPDVNCGYYNAFMSTPGVEIGNAAPGTLSLRFDSSWRPEGFDDGAATNNQTAIIKAFYTVGGVEQPGVEVLHWDSDDQGLEAGDYFKPDATNESVTLTDAQLQVPAGATSVRFEFSLTNAGNDWWWAIDNVGVSGDVGGTVTTLFAEDFEGVTLEPPVHEVPSGCGVTYCNELVYTHTGPNGVSVTVAGPATGGVPDWRGWSFVERPFWQCASGGPNGSAFFNSSGKLAVADGDEFDDLPHDDGQLDTTMSTPVIDVSGRTGNVLVLSFDSSWRWENPQAASVTAEFNTGSSAEVIRWESDPGSPFFKGDAVNERVAVAVLVPPGATSLTLRFRYTAGNNWWWAIDNLSLFEGQAEVTVAANAPTQSPMIIAPTVDYAPCFTPWSPTAPSGWGQVFTPIGACPAECGRPEWRGWTFAFKDWWSTQVDDQLRSEFTRASGFVAIADPDEWDDFPNGRSNFNAFLTTPSIALPGAVSSAMLSFDSSWRPEGFDDSCSCDPQGAPPSNNQTAIIKAFYTVGGVEQPGVEVLHWDSDNAGQAPGEYYKPDATNEGVEIPQGSLAIPAGATAVRFEFSLTNARNDWWWAIDNVAFSVNGAGVFSEGFEMVPELQAPPTENPPVAQCAYFSSVTSQGGNLAVDNSGLLNCSPGDDFYGFNAWLVDAWARALGGERWQHQSPTAYISDFAARGCDGTTRLTTPDYSIGGLNPGSLQLAFRSGWLSEAGHASSVEISYDAGVSWVSVLAWTPANKATTPDEVVVLPLNNPEGASTVRVRFTDAESGWWAIGAFELTGLVGQPVSCDADLNCDGSPDQGDVACIILAVAGDLSCICQDPDFNLDGSADQGDVAALIGVVAGAPCP